MQVQFPLPHTPQIFYDYSAALKYSDSSFYTIVQVDSTNNRVQKLTFTDLESLAANTPVEQWQYFYDSST